MHLQSSNIVPGVPVISILGRFRLLEIVGSMSSPMEWIAVLLRFVVSGYCGRAASRLACILPFHVAARLHAGRVWQLTDVC